ncbi:MAG TPA: methyltransferase domain-containing protein [Thermoleophilaceae bacterium]
MSPARRKDPIERTLDLIQPSKLPAVPHVEAGYLDLLGEERVAGSHPGQQLMESTGLALIYERLWRPVLGRLLMGAVGPGMDDERKIAAEMLELAPGDLVLDVGCGPGNFARSFADEVEDDGLVVGLDASGAMLARAVRETASGSVCYVRGNASDLPFEDESFDAVCCFAALYLIEDPMGAIDEIARVLRPDGRVAILTSVNRGLLPTALANAFARPLTGVRIFGRHDITRALERRGLMRPAQRVSGLAQFVSARKRARRPQRPA